MFTGIIIGLALTLSAMNGAFEQGQANPEAKNFFVSKSSAYNPDTKVYGVDEIN
tara:strand:- start:827 stop:988 length:162 start_codon:yes stop_codon:yes gene_type:complete